MWINISYTYKINSWWTCIEKNFDQKVSLNYQKIDSDEDWLDDKFEVQNWLNPIIADIDLDWWKDWEEINLWTDAKNWCDWSNNIPVDNDWDWLWKTFEDKYTNWVNQWNKIFIKWWNVNWEDWTQSWFNLIDLPDWTNPNSDWDWVLDWKEDFDNDWLTNKEEQIKWTNPNNWDTDWDWIEDTLDVKPNNPWNIILPENYIFNSDIDSDIYWPDSDLDWLSDKYEIKIWTDPNNADSDNDWIPDWIEVAAKRLWDLNWDPNNAWKTPIDTDWDFLPDVFEDLYENFNKNNPDWNLWEKLWWNWKFDWFEDNDNDWIINIFELIYWTDPNNADTDWDWVYDWIEITASKLWDLNWNPINSELKPVDSDFNWIPDIYDEKYWQISIDQINNDNDLDWLSHFEELKKWTNPNSKDSDWDWIEDSIDIFPTDANNLWLFTITELENLLKNIDSDFDWISDYDEINNITSTDPFNPDSDWDWVIDWIEVAVQILWDLNWDPNNAWKTPIDTDWDLLPDSFETYTWFTIWTEFLTNFELWNYFKMNASNPNTYSTSIIDAFADADNDWLSNLNELLWWTSPYNNDSDWDWILDWIDSNSIKPQVPNENLVNYILPTDWDFDWDWISNIDEFNLWTNPRNKDTDWDWIEDWIEIAMKKFWWDTNSDPLNNTKTPADTDNDWIPDLVENFYESPKYNPWFSNSIDNSSWWTLDYDNDWLSNILEIVKNTNPFDWDYDNDWVPDWVDQNPNSWNFQGDYNLFLDSDWDWLSDAYEISMKENFWWYWIFDEFNANLPANWWDSDWDWLANLFEDFNFENLLNFTTLKKDDSTTYNNSTTPQWDWNLSDKYFDVDWDWLWNLTELLFWTNPYSTDTDWDWIPDNIDPNPIVYWNWVDTDMDWIPDYTEIYWFTWTILIDGSTTDLKLFTNSLKYDSDLDWLSDWYEKYHQLNPLLKNTDWDWWEDWVEVNVWYINSTKWNSNDSLIYPTDTDNDWLSDEWENYYVWNLTNLSKNWDKDWDWLSDYKEMQIWSDPTQNNFILKFDWTNQLSLNSWSNTWQIITITIPYNLNNIDKKNSWFFTYSSSWSQYWWINSVINKIFMPSWTWFWINDNKNWSSINWTLVSTWKFAKNANPLWPNKIEIFIKKDSYEPYVWLKIIDFISWKLPDSLWDIWDADYNWFLANQKDNEKDTYLWQSHVDATPPVCWIILSWWNHEQNHWLNIPVTWQENLWWTTWGTIYNKNLSMLTNEENITIFNTFKNILSSLWIWEKKYEWDFEKNSQWYIPWTRWTWSTAELKAIQYQDYYQDNLSWLKKSEVKMLNPDKIVSWDTWSWNNLRDSIWWWPQYIPWDKHTICTLDKVWNTASCDATELSNWNTWYSWKKVWIKIFDEAWNYNYCQSAVTKVDDSFPLVNIKNIIDKHWVDSLWDYASWVWAIWTNEWYTFWLELNDSKTYLNWETTTDFLEDWVNPLNWNSWFNPYDFDIWKVYYCWKWTTEEEKNNCIYEITAFPWMAWYLTENQLDEKYLYTTTWATSSWVFAQWWWDIPLPWWILFMKDAYFTTTWVLLTWTWMNYVEDTWILTKWTDWKIILTSTQTWSINWTITYPQQRQVLFIETWVYSWAYLSTVSWLYKVDDTWWWIPNWIEILKENRMLGENELPVRKWKTAFKIYSNTDTNIWAQPWDYFYISFDFMDRAWNWLPLQYWFVIKENVYAKILWNIQSWQKTVTFDQNVQTFELKESAVKNAIEKVKSNITDLLPNAKDANWSWILVTTLSDLNDYKITLWDEDIYLVKNWNIILWTWTTTLNLDPYWDKKPISIITYWWNILFNAKYIDASENTAYVALIDPYLSTTTWATHPQLKPLESQWNILISPELLVWKWQIIAEWSMMSFANIWWTIQTIFDITSRRTIFKNQLIWDWTMLSNNTVWWYELWTCPVSIYWFWNKCWFWDNLNADEEKQLQAISLTYDLHHLREYIFDNTESSIQISTNPTLPTWNLTNKMNEIFKSDNNFSSNIPQMTTNNFKWIDVIKQIWASTLSAPEKLKELTNSVSKMYQYPIIIKHSVPTKELKILK